MTKETETTKTKWKPKDYRFVGFLDILGFKDLVMRKSHDEIYEHLSTISKTKKWIENIPNDKQNIDLFGNAEIHIVNFSDSIVVFSKNDDFDNFKYFLKALRWLFAKAIKKGIPLKGGIAHGQISVNKSEQIYFGQAIIDAYLLEEDVNYFGMVMHNSIDEYMNNHHELSDNEIIKKLVFEDYVPLKSGKIKHKNINWFTKAYPFTDIHEKDAVLNSIKSTIENFRRSVSGSPRKYIDNTLEILDKFDIEYIINEKNK